ncbi:putative solute-binding protein [Amnimonas aquatica]|uniref:AdeT n=1 Tax=Amnimonas aquatica TaxID=2094561 RepID=A0A2P6ASP4_9GAMM|nr:putative solute-binding protein [Amnimonas aquatica]PQA42923.1 hypothetical protein C5O18_05530 [Amnimonas aquatica]
MKTRNQRLLVLAALLTAATPATAQRLCVYDLLGAQGDIFNMAKDYAVQAAREGVKLELKSYTDERVATEDLRAGQCDALMATGFRTRMFNPVAGALDSLGATTVIRNNKVDMAASYEVVQKTAQTFANPAAAKLMVRGNYEIGGIIPFGVAYPVVNDRKINTVEALAGKKIAAFDYDKAQAIMIERIGAQPVSADITSFAGKFNNGSVDFIAAPAMAYKPLELHRGIGSKGAIQRFPILILTYQVVLNQSKFPAGFGQKSREYWNGQFSRAMALIQKAERDVPAATWGDLTPDNMIKYTVMLRDARIDIAEQGVYDKQGLKIIKRVRCSLNAADSECATNSENW